MGAVFNKRLMMIVEFPTYSGHLEEMQLGCYCISSQNNILNLS